MQWLKMRFRLNQHQVLRHQATFRIRIQGKHKWYENANGLVEIDVNQGNAASALNLAVGDSVLIE